MRFFQGSFRKFCDASLPSLLQVYTLICLFLFLNLCQSRLFFLFAGRNFYFEVLEAPPNLFHAIYLTLHNFANSLCFLFNDFFVEIPIFGYFSLYFLLFHAPFIVFMMQLFLFVSFILQVLLFLFPSSSAPTSIFYTLFLHSLVVFF